MARLDWYIRANLKLRHMQLLVALDDMRHVGRAADLLNISQPAVSKSLSEIERGLGLRLFERGARGIVPTEYGDCLVGLSRDTLQRLEATGERLRHLQHGAGGRVRVGVLPVAAPVLVPRAVMRLRERAPSCRVVLHEAMVDRLLQMLHEEQLDLVVGTVPPASSTSGLMQRVFAEEEGVVVVCGAHHPLAALPRVETSALAAHALVIPTVGTVFRTMVERTLDALDLSVGGALTESGSITAINTLLRETEALSVYPRHLARHYVQLGWLQVLPVTVPRIAVPVGAVWPRHRELGVSAGMFLDMLGEVASELLGPAVRPSGPDA